MANDTAFRAGRFLQGQVTQDFAGCGPGNPAGLAGAAAGPGAAVTATIECNPSAVDACPTLRGCQTVPPTGLCTPVPEFCPTFCGPECQTPQPNCTSINCTQAGPQCPPPTIPPQCPVGTNVILDCTFGCTQFGPACPVTPFPQCGNVTADASCQTVNVQPQAVGAAAGGVNITLLTVPVWACGPTPATRCFVCPPITFDFNCNLQQQAGGAVGAAPFAAQGLGRLGGLGTITVPPTQFDLRCPTITIFTIQCLVIGNPTRFDAECLTRGCPPFTPDCPPQTPDCPPSPPCPTPGFNCSAFAVCTIAFPQCGGGGTVVVGSAFCPTPGFNCSSFAVCTIAFPQCGGGGTVVFDPARPRLGITDPTPASRCFVCDPAFAAGGGEQLAARGTAATVCTQASPQCPSAVDACPTRICTPATVCTQFGCGGGGQTAATVCTQFSHQCRSAVDACPTRFCGGGGAAGAAAAPGTWPTPATRCRVCHPVAAAIPNTVATVCTQYGPGCHTYPNGDCTFFGCGPGGGGGIEAQVGAAAGGGPAPTVGFCLPRTMTFNCRPRTMAPCPTMLGCGLEGAQPEQVGAPQQPSAVDACPTRICTPATVCTQFGCGGGGQTAATVCTQFGHQCRSAVDACPTRLCGGGGAVGAAAVPGTWPTPQTRCFVCDPVAARGPNTAATACTQFGHQCRSAVDACPTRLCNQQAVGTWPTPMTRCFIC